MMKLLRMCVFFIAMVFSISVNTTVARAADNTLVVFSGRKEPLIKPVIALFERQTGIKAILKTGKSAALSRQILQELPRPSVDIFIAKESGSLEFMRMNKGFAIYESPATRRIPAGLKSGDGSWIGVCGRSRAVIYNKDLINDKDLPSKLNDLLDRKYKGKIAAVNSGNESFIAWVSALRIQLGQKATRRILQGLKNNDIALISKSHTDVRKAVGRGEYPLGLINHYYYHLQKLEIDKNLRNVGVIYLDQHKDGRGELVNVSGAGIVQNAPHMDNARMFIDFLVSDEAQRLFAQINFEYPLVTGVQTHPDVLAAMHCRSDSALSCLSRMNVPLNRLGEEMNGTLNLLDEVGWN